MERTSLEVVTFVVRTMAQTAVDNEKYFGDLDAVVGDGDFGYSLALVRLDDALVKLLDAPAEVAVRIF